MCRGGDINHAAATSRTAEKWSDLATLRGKRMSASGHEHACCLPRRGGKSASVTRRNRRSAANGWSVPAAEMTTFSSEFFSAGRDTALAAGRQSVVTGR
jgi:hypothetical protein